MAIPPIFVWDSGSLDIFRSVPQAEDYVEPIDVENGVYEGFDAHGFCLRFSVVRCAEQSKGRWRLRRSPSERTQISLHDPPVLDPMRLRAFILEGLRSRGVREDPELLRLELDELVGRAIIDLGFTKG